MRTLLIVLLCVGPARGGEPDDAKVDFTRDVRPILANNCLLCHGPDAKGRKADLRLDVRESALAVHEGRAAIVPGKPEKSELFRRISTTDREEAMPPAKTGKKLAAGQVETLRRWIEQGAPYARHWAFVKPERPVLPAVRDAAWPKNEIDRFILARLEKEGLKPSPEADRETLIRRAALDLTGLPPAPGEFDGDAYEKVVDRLLESPAFGERWARAWLDLARYADSQGYAEDRPRMIWVYRDWVVRALNENMPFDRFTLEQLAGDLLPGSGESQLQATAFHRNTLTNTEGGTDDEEFRNIAVVDRVNTTMQVWMGLTLNCAQCHDHKFDPFSQEEYFRIFAFFNNTEDSDQGDDKPLLSMYSEEQKRQKKEGEEEIARLEASLQQSTPELEAARGKWEAGFHKPVAWREAASDLKAITAIRVETAGKYTLRYSPADARPPSARIVRVELPGKQRTLHLAEVQVWSGGANAALKGAAKQSSTAYEGPAKLAIDGNTNGDYFGAKSTTHTNVEDEPWWEVDLGRSVPVEKIVLWNRTDGGDALQVRMKGYRVKLLDEKRKPVDERMYDDYPKPTAEHTFDGSREVALRAAAADAKILLPEKPISLAAGTKLDVRPAGRFSFTDDPFAPSHSETPADIRAILGRPEAERLKEQAAKAAAYHRSVAPELAPAREKLAALRKKIEGIKPAATVPVMRELAAGRRRTTKVHVRGNFLVKGQEVSEGVPAVFAATAEVPKNRLAFAQWLVHPDNPLTARVAVNRHWEQIFGMGLVATSEDFGVRGDLPSHPELLDWLATEMKWDVKKLLRLMVTSAAYRQSSQVTPELLARDPSNRLLARGPRVRLPAEAVRDQALFVSGLLSRKMAGPSVYPLQPKSGLSAAFSSSTDWETSKGEDRHRRGLYTFWRRSVPYPSMATFDTPDMNVCTVRRVPTNTPLQALVTMNDPVYVEASQALARRLVAAPTARERVVLGFRLCLARPPRDAEIVRLVALYEQSRARFAADPKKALAMATDPLGPVPQGADVADLAAWTVVANVLLNLDEMFLKR